MEIKESQRIINELRAWVDGGRGRRAEVARVLGKSPQLISDWLAGRAAPRLDVAFELRDFLANPDKFRKKSDG
jgi:hypothetical protein